MVAMKAEKNFAQTLSRTVISGIDHDYNVNDNYEMLLAIITNALEMFTPMRKATGPKIKLPQYLHTLHKVHAFKLASNFPS